MISRRIPYLLICLIAACAVVPEQQVEGYRLTVMRAVAPQKRWSFEGRLALINETDSVSGSVIWRHDEVHDDIELAGPLGQGRTRISVAAKRVVVDDGDNARVFYGEPDKIFAEQVGVGIPVDALKFWVLGVNDPEQAFIEQPGGFYQGGWLVTYREMQAVNARLLPKKIVAVKDKTRIKLIVDQWNLL